MGPKNAPCQSGIILLSIRPLIYSASDPIYQSSPAKPTYPTTTRNIAAVLAPSFKENCLLGGCFVL